MQKHVNFSGKSHFSAGFLGLLVCALLALSSCSKDDKDITPDLPDAAGCTPVPAAHGLSVDASSGIFTYVGNGGTTITIDLDDQIKVQYNGLSGFELLFWGVNTASGLTRLAGNHQSINGKHIKDRDGLALSVVMPDGVKITMLAAGPDYSSSLKWISIVDGSRAQLINMTCGTVIYSGNSQALANALDERDADGETSEISITATGVTWNNIYTESSPGNKVEALVPLAELSFAQPSQVRDFYDDPRLGHT